MPDRTMMKVLCLTLERNYLQDQADESWKSPTWMFCLEFNSIAGWPNLTGWSLPWWDPKDSLVFTGISLWFHPWSQPIRLCLLLHCVSGMEGESGPAKYKFLMHRNDQKPSREDLPCCHWGSMKCDTKDDSLFSESFGELRLALASVKEMVQCFSSSVPAMILLILFALLSSGRWTEAAGHKLFMVLSFLHHETDVCMLPWLACSHTHIVWLYWNYSSPALQNELFILIADEPWSKSSLRGQRGDLAKLVHRNLGILKAQSQKDW